MATIKINYKSDFDFIVKLTEQGQDIGFPSWDFDVVVTTDNTDDPCNYNLTRKRVYLATRRADALVNCVNENNRLRVTCDNHGLQPGKVNIEFHAYLPDAEYRDGNHLVVTPEITDVELVEGAGDTDVADIELSATIHDILSAMKQSLTDVANATEECKSATEECKSATELCIDKAADADKAADECKAATERCIDKTTEATEATDECKLATERCIDKTADADKAAQDCNTMVTDAEKRISDLEKSAQECIDGATGATEKCNYATEECKSATELCIDKAADADKAADECKAATADLTQTKESCEAVTDACRYATEECKSVTSGISDALTTLKTRVDIIGDPVATESYQEGTLYYTGDVVEKDGKLHKFIQDGEGSWAADQNNVEDWSYQQQQDQCLDELKEVVDSNRELCEKVAYESIPALEAKENEQDRHLTAIGELPYEVFDPTKEYSSGEYVMYQNKLYQFTSPHAAGEWTGADATPSCFLEQLQKEASSGGVGKEYLNEDGTRGEIFNDYSGNVASGDKSHAEGYKTKATEKYSHAEGNSTTASGESSHAEGVDTIASGGNSHAEGGSTEAKGYKSHAEGNGTSTVGDYSHAEGSGTIAGGESSHAEGVDTTAGGGDSHAEGSVTKALGDSSHAEGVGTTAGGENSHAEGAGTTAEGDNSHAEGAGTIASGTKSHAEGSSTTAEGDNSHAEGAGTKAQGKYSHAEGSSTTASGESSHAEGSSTTASGLGSHAEGTGTASSYYSHAEGYGTASGGYSHAEGSGTKAQGEESHAEGHDTTASGDYSHAEGELTTASGLASHAEGGSTTASGEDSHAEGFNTTASGECQHVQGINNIPDPDGKYADIVGWGSYWGDPKNIETTSVTGTKWLAEDVKIGGTSDEDSNAISVKDELAKKLDSAIIVQKAGTSTNSVMSQKAVTDEVGCKGAEGVKMPLGTTFMRSSEKTLSMVFRIGDFTSIDTRCDILWTDDYVTEGAYCYITKGRIGFRFGVYTFGFDIDGLKQIHLVITFGDELITCYANGVAYSFSNDEYMTRELKYSISTSGRYEETLRFYNIRTFDYALSQSEVDVLYNQGRCGDAVLTSTMRTGIVDEFLPSSLHATQWDNTGTSTTPIALTDAVFSFEKPFNELTLIHFGDTLPTPSAVSQMVRNVDTNEVYVSQAKPNTRQWATTDYKNVGGAVTAAGEYVPQAFIDQWNNAGSSAKGNYGKWNVGNGYFELNGLTDITYQQALDIYHDTYDKNWLRLKYFLSNSFIRTNFVFKSEQSYDLEFAENYCYNAYNIEKVYLTRNSVVLPDSANNMFAYCAKLKDIIGNLDCGNVTTASNMFAGCSVLEYVYLDYVGISISFADSPNISRSTISWLLMRRYNTAPITITLHATAYARLSTDSSITSLLPAMGSKAAVTLASA